MFSFKSEFEIPIKATYIVKVNEELITNKKKEGKKRAGLAWGELRRGTE
jgi:hypothetical protein